MRMNERNAVKITSLTVAYYKLRLAKIKHPDQKERLAQYVGWSSRENQHMSFEAACDLAGVDWTKVKNVLDAGCGFGGLAGYLRKEKGFRGEYVGIDIVGDFIEKARDMHGSTPGNRFVLKNILDHDWAGGRFDVIVSIGGLGLNHDLPDPYGERSRMYAEHLIDHIAKGAISAMSIYFPNEDNFDASGKSWEMAFYKPREIEHMIRSACKDRFGRVTFTSYPEPNDMKTMAKVYLK